MANWYEMTPDQAAEWEAWKSAPGREPVRDLCERFPPNKLFRMKSTGQRCYPQSYAENGTLTVAVTGQFNRILFGRSVFGVNPDDLEECELPDPTEDVGDTAQEAGYTEEDIRAILIPELKRRRAEAN